MFNKTKLEEKEKEKEKKQERKKERKTLSIIPFILSTKIENRNRKSCDAYIERFFISFLSLFFLNFFVGDFKCYSRLKT